MVTTFSRRSRRFGLLAGAALSLSLFGGAIAEPAQASVLATCNGLPVTDWVQEGVTFIGSGVIEGTPASDRIIATGASTICGRGDSDEIDGSEQIDWVSGGPGDDVIDGRGGADTLFGNENEDTIEGNDGDDTLRGGDHDDVLSGGDNNDVLHCGLGEHDDADGGSQDVNSQDELVSSTNHGCETFSDVP
jgi:Ca2+-binding RTX toxin-like protein